MTIQEIIARRDRAIKVRILGFAALPTDTKKDLEMLAAGIDELFQLGNEDWQKIHTGTLIENSVRNMIEGAGAEVKS